MAAAAPRSYASAASKAAAAPKPAPAPKPAAEVTPQPVAQAERAPVAQAPAPARPVASAAPAQAAAPATASAAAPAAENGRLEFKDVTSKDYYFDSYSHFGIHEEMLKDRVRTETYMKAITHNRHLFEGKVVLDVGCGTGILCLFAAKAGAAKVIGIDRASIVEQAQEIVRVNGFSHVITLLNGKVEEVELPVDKVDIIISEWMGYFLLYESMLDTVIFARDKWLRPGGLLFPDRAQLFLCAIEDAEYRQDKLDFWDNVYGFNMSCIKEMALVEPLVDVCNPDQVISDSCCVLDKDIGTIKASEVEFSNPFEIHFDREETCHALVAYFTVDFSACSKPTRFSTGPKSRATHWKQTVFYLQEPVTVRRGDALRGTIAVKRNARNPRDLDIDLEGALEGSHAYSMRQSYRLR